MRAAAVRKKVEKEKEGASSSAPKVIGNGAPKRKLTGRTTALPRKYQSPLGRSILRSRRLPSQVMGQAKA